MEQQSPPNAADDQAHVDDLRADLAKAEEHLARITAEYEEMLTDHDTIQEDCDATAQAVADARAVVARAEAAVARAEAGQYGRCERCGSPIPQERLTALPDATTCVSCA
jgi:RNA polymerase-binding transcription factor DksA